MANPPWLEYQTGPTTIPLGPRDPTKARAEAREEQRLRMAEQAAARATAAAERAANAAPAGYRWGADGRLEAIPGGPADTARAGKAMRQGDADHLEEQINAYSYLKQAMGTFDDRFAGNTITGGLENTAQKLIGTGTPGQADWWANFKTADNLIRNKLFGASLTAGEKKAYEETTISPRMEPAFIRQNLARRAEIARNVLSRRVNRLHTIYNPAEVEAQLGEFRDELLANKPKAEDDRKDEGPPGAAAAPPVGPELAPATGATKTEIEHTPTDRKLAAMLSAGAPSANIRAVAKASGFPTGQIEKVLAWRAMNPKYKGGYDVHSERIVPTTAFNRWAADPMRAGLLAAADAGTAGLTDEATGAVNALRTGQPLPEAIAAADYAKQANLAANPRAALAGSVLGGGASMIGGGLAMKGALRAGARGGAGRNLLAWASRNPLKAATLGDTAYGAAYGAGENNDNRALGATVGGITAPIASVVGQQGTRALGAGLRGVNNAAVDRLRAAGIPLTVGEVLGGGWKKAQDAMTSVFGPGDMVARRYGEGRQALNEAAFNEAGQTIGTPINAVGQPGIEALDAAKSRAYSSALDPVSINAIDPAFAGDLGAIRATAAKIPNDEGASDAAINALNYRIGNAIDPATGALSGRNFQEAYRGLARTAKERAPKAYGHEVGQTMRGAQDALVDVLERQSPGTHADFLKANAANRHLSILADAVNAAKNQVDDQGNILFTPAQLGQAATSNAKTYGGKIAAASGDRPFNVLARDAQQVMSSKLPDSGTPARLLAMGLASGGALTGGGIGYGAGGGEGAAAGAAVPLGLLTALGTRRGQQLLTAALLNRVRPFRIAGQSRALSGPLGGDILASFGIPLAAGE